MNESLRGSALLQRTAADQWQHLPSGLTVIARPMPDYSAAHVIWLRISAPSIRIL